MNTFASVLLAFPFYLAIKGRLSAYVNLAKPGQTTATNTSSGTNAAPASGTAATPAAGVTSQQLMNAAITALSITG